LLNCNILINNNRISRIYILTTVNGPPWYTVNGHKYSSPSILRYIFHIKPHFNFFLLWSHFKSTFFPKNILKLSLGRYLWNLFEDTQNSLNFIWRHAELFEFYLHFQFLFIVKSFLSGFWSFLHQKKQKYLKIIYLF
jgi:hypothetical protein